MNDSFLRTFKHDLRTPINHIIGYSELLLEEAGDESDSAAVQLFTAIQSQGKALFDLLERTAPAPSVSWNDANLEQLQQGSRPIVAQLLELSSSANGPYDDILGKIGEAAQRFTNLVQKALVP